MKADTKDSIRARKHVLFRKWIAPLNSACWGPLKVNKGRVFEMSHWTFSVYISGCNQLHQVETKYKGEEFLKILKI